MNKSSNSPEYCRYFHVSIVQPEKTWLVAAELKSVDHLAFDRALRETIFELFVPQSMVEPFLETMERLRAVGVIGEVKELANRFAS